MKRVNEFGFSAEMLDEKNKGNIANGGEQAAIEGTEAVKPPADKKDD